MPSHRLLCLTGAAAVSVLLLAAWCNAASANPACANNDQCICDPRDLLPAGCTRTRVSAMGSFHNGRLRSMQAPDSWSYIKDPTYLRTGTTAATATPRPPSIVQAEGFVQSFCAGSYKPDKSRTLPVGGIRSAHVVQSSPGAFDDGGQYDTSTFAQCGKEPYSVVDPSSPNPKRPSRPSTSTSKKPATASTCMRICEGPDLLLRPRRTLSAPTRAPMPPCDSSQDTKGLAKPDVLGVRCRRSPRRRPAPSSAAKDFSDVTHGVPARAASPSASTSVKSPGRR
ncbi:hypothetical protein DFJ73DRAFT_879553 [Zopfochytrium polystomum]|nr:hypothetical protein DFJ73DRAFT_879553 [Zopfochytrium polystomum]